MDVADIAFLPEGKTVEFKRDLSSIKPIMKTLVAFANTAGGTLLIGRDNDGTIVGVKDIFEAEEKLANAIADSILPPLMPEIEITSYKGKALLLIRVAHWKGPFYIKSQGPNDGVYIRLGSTNRAASAEFIAELKRSFSNTSFDQLPCPSVDVNGLDKKRIEQAFGRKMNLQELETLGILVSNGKNLVSSNGGIILFGQDPIRNKYFPNAEVRAARFQGVDKVDFIDQYDCPGTIIEAMKEIPNFIRRNTRLSAKIDQFQRKDIPEYPQIALREVLTNAFVHADYSIQGMKTRIAIYSNRMEIENPGMLPFGYTLDKFTCGVSHIRNKVIARTFRELHLMEEWGSGYRRITEACRSSEYQIPNWEEIGTTIRVTFKPHSASLDKLPAEMMVRESEKEMSFRKHKIFILLQNKGPLSAKSIHKELKEPVSERALRNDLLELKASGLIKMLGGGRNSLWILSLYPLN